MSIAILQNEKEKMLVPQLRFPEFREAWEITPLINLSINGFSNGAFNDPKKVGSGYRIINVKDMYIDGTINIDTLNRVAIDEKEFSKNRVEYGDIFFTRSSLVKEGIAHSNVNLNTVDDLTFDGHLIRMRPKKEIHSPVFLYYNFATQTARQQLIERGKTTTMTTIGQEDIAKVRISYPTLSEQQKIASFLSAVDEKIQQLSRKKELLSQYKKGVVQQLFSGKLRFKDENGKNYADWEEKKLGKLIEICSSKRVLQEDWKDEGVPFLRTREIINLSNKKEFRTPIYITETLYEELKLKYGIPQNGDLLVTGVGTIGEAYIVNKTDKFYFKDGNVIWFKMNEKINSMYLWQLFQTKYIKKQLSNNASITTVATFTIDGARKTTIIYPCLEEQQKIAAFLSSIDAKIESTSQEIIKTQSFKKGLLQQLFV